MQAYHAFNHLYRTTFDLDSDQSTLAHHIYNSCIMEASIAGPSRLPTISTEDEEVAAESGVAVPPAQPTSAGPTGDLETQPPARPDPNALPESACETLYIQNLNEKVQVEGKSEA
jgi:hypothetical protein